MLVNKVKFMVFSVAVILTANVAHAEEHVVAQSNKTFMLKGAKIEKLTVKVGDSISFKNEDAFFHNIFSLSDLKTFDLGSYAQGQAKSVVFDKAGMVEVECAIHPSMQLKVEVK
jgi:plastocyanin